MKALIDVIDGRKSCRMPIWFMRQAGRYLPEYIALRKKVEAAGGNFLSMCYDPNIASEITLQPIHRFDIDAAIIFADILVVPDALGCDVNFINGIGPKVKVCENIADLKRLQLDNVADKFSLIAKSISIVKQRIPDHISLIGFAGSPFTVAAYMICGGKIGTGEILRAKLYDYDFFTKLLKIITMATIKYLEMQIVAGADVLQIFESHASYACNELLFWKYIADPNHEIINFLRNKYPHIPIMFFPRGAGTYYEYISQQMIESHLNFGNVLSLDEAVCDAWIVEQIDKGLIVQGNLDNHLACYGCDAEILGRVDVIMQKFGHGKFIFNFGHGILQHTKHETIAKIVSHIRAKDVAMI